MKHHDKQETCDRCLKNTKTGLGSMFIVSADGQQAWSYRFCEKCYDELCKLWWHPKRRGKSQ